MFDQELLKEKLEQVKAIAEARIAFNENLLALAKEVGSKNFIEFYAATLVGYNENFSPLFIQDMELTSRAFGVTEDFYSDQVKKNTTGIEEDIEVYHRISTMIDKISNATSNSDEQVEGIDKLREFLRKTAALRKFLFNKDHSHDGFLDKLKLKVQLRRKREKQKTQIKERMKEINEGIYFEEMLEIFNLRSSAQNIFEDKIEYDFSTVGAKAYVTIRVKGYSGDLYSLYRNLEKEVDKEMSPLCSLPATGNVASLIDKAKEQIGKIKGAAKQEEVVVDIRGLFKIIFEIRQLSLVLNQNKIELKDLCSKEEKSRVKLEEIMTSELSVEHELILASGNLIEQRRIQKQEQPHQIESLKRKEEESRSRVKFEQLVYYKYLVGCKRFIEKEEESRSRIKFEQLDYYKHLVGHKRFIEEEILKKSASISKVKTVIPDLPRHENCENTAGFQLEQELSSSALSTLINLLAVCKKERGADDKITFSSMKALMRELGAEEVNSYGSVRKYRLQSSLLYTLDELNSQKANANFVVHEPHGSKDKSSGVLNSFVVKNFIHFLERLNVFNLLNELDETRKNTIRPT